MDFQNVKDITINGTNCVIDITRGDSDICSFVSAKEKSFDVQNDKGTLTVTQRSSAILYRIIMKRFEFKLILPKNFKGRLRFRNKNGGLYIKNCDFTEMELSAKNCKFDIKNVTCLGLGLKTKNGSMDIQRVTASDAVTVKCANGNVKAETVISPSLEISCSNAGVTAIDIKSDKIICSTRNGTVDASAVACSELKLDASNGKITAMILGSRDDYRMSLETSNGGIMVDGTPSKKVADASSVIKKRITAHTSNGDIDIKFIA